MVVNTKAVVRSEHEGKVQRILKGKVSRTLLNAVTKGEEGVNDGISIHGLENRGNRFIHLGNSEGRADLGGRIKST